MESDCWSEIWKDVVYDEQFSESEIHKVSSCGRMKSYKQFKHGKILKLGVVRGYRRINLQLKNGKKSGLYVHRIVAEAFVKKPSEEHKYVIHLDFNKLNNIASNLKWVTFEEKNKHVGRITKMSQPKKRNSKLSESEVILIKKILFDPNRKTRLKLIAKRFGITTMQLHRIKTGENWGHVKI